MKYVIIFLLLFINGCGESSECVYQFEAGGLTACTPQPLDSDEITRTVELVELEVQKHYPQVTNLSKSLREFDVWVHFIDTEGDLALGCDNTQFEDLYVCDKTITGHNKGGSLLIVQYRECLGYSSLAHEIIHSVEFFYLMDIIEDINSHMTPHLFTSSGPGSVEELVESQMIEELDSCN